MQPAGQHDAYCPVRGKHEAPGLPGALCLRMVNHIRMSRYGHEDEIAWKALSPAVHDRFTPHWPH